MKIKVRDLEVGMIVTMFGHTAPIKNLEIDSRRDGYWIDNGIRSHRWYREEMEVHSHV